MPVKSKNFARRALLLSVDAAIRGDASAVEKLLWSTEKRWFMFNVISVAGWLLRRREELESVSILVNRFSTRANDFSKNKNRARMRIKNRNRRIKGLVELERGNTAVNSDVTEHGAYKIGYSGLEHWRRYLVTKKKHEAIVAKKLLKRALRSIKYCTAFKVALLRCYKLLNKSKRINEFTQRECGSKHPDLYFLRETIESLDDEIKDKATKLLLRKDHLLEEDFTLKLLAIVHAKCVSETELNDFKKTSSEENANLCTQECKELCGYTLELHPDYVTVCRLAYKRKSIVDWKIVVDRMKDSTREELNDIIEKLLPETEA